MGVSEVVGTPSDSKWVLLSVLILGGSSGRRGITALGPTGLTGKSGMGKTQGRLGSPDRPGSSLGLVSTLLVWETEWRLLGGHWPTGSCGSLVWELVLLVRGACP